MKKDQKLQLVEDIKNEFNDKSSFILMDYRGINNSDFTNFRNELRENNIAIKVIKNTLIKIAVKDTKLEILSPYLSGPNVVVYGSDIVAVAKQVSKACDNNEHLKFTTGYYGNDDEGNILSKEDVIKLSKLKSMDEIRASFIGILTSAQSRFVNLISTPTRNVVTILKSYRDSKGS
jgi:large subunit ribosomal protein L10